MNQYHGQLTTVSIDETKRYAGIKHNQSFPDSKVQAACLEAQLLANPKGLYEFFPYNAQTHYIETTVPLKLTGTSITRHLNRCCYAAIMAITVGLDIETAVTRHFANGDYTAGLLLDAAATVTVETIADQVNTLIQATAAKKGYTTTWRFSPGYGDWDIHIQLPILTALNANSIGLTVTESMMLMPRKSITAVIGLRPNNSTCPHSSTKSSCTTCNQKNCIARKEKKL